MVSIRNCEPSASSKAGVTLLDVLLAMVVVAFVAGPLLRALAVSAILRGRSKHIAQAAIVAGNEAERLKLISRRGHIPNDTIYETTINRTVYRVERKNISAFSNEPLFEAEMNQEFSLRVNLADRDTTLVSFRLLQGRIP